MEDDICAVVPAEHPLANREDLPLALLEAGALAEAADCFERAANMR